MNKVLVFLTLLGLTTLAIAQAPQGPGADKDEFLKIEPGSREANRRLRIECDNQFRLVNGVCTGRPSLGTRSRTVWGSSNRAQFSYFAGADSKVMRGDNLPSTRFISNTVFDQTRDVRDSRRVNQLAVFLGQFVDHTLLSTPFSINPDVRPIPIPEGDSRARNTPQGPRDTLLFIRSERVPVSRRSTDELPQNANTPVLDLANVYGSNFARNQGLRTLTDGLMKTGANNMLPRNDNQNGFLNFPDNSNRFLVAGDFRSSENPVLTSFHTIFLREHNLIAADLKVANPTFSDNLLYENARKINEAQWQKIIFEEWYPAITGRRLSRYAGLRNSVDTTVSVLFSTAAFRVGHTMVDRVVQRWGPGNSPKNTHQIEDTFFRPATFFEGFGPDGFLRGAANTVCQKVDVQVTDGLRNALFNRVQAPGTPFFDLISLNLQRGRDHGLPSYNEIRQRFGFAPVSAFSQITSDVSVQNKLRTAYTDVSRVEALAGLFAEDHASNSSFGPLILRIWAAEFSRFRDGDRFFFRRPGQFSSAEIAASPRLQAVFNGDDILRAVILRNTGIANGDLPDKMFMANN